MNRSIDRTWIEETVLGAMAEANKARRADQQLDISPTAVIFGPPSPLDSLGLVTLLIDIEEALHSVGIDVTLSDERAVSRTRSPFRSVPSLVAYIEALAAGVV